MESSFVPQPTAAAHNSFLVLLLLLLVLVTAGASQPPTANPASATTGAATPMNITLSVSATGGVKIFKFGTAKYGTVTAIVAEAKPAVPGDMEYFNLIALYTPTISSIDPKTGAADAFTYTVSDPLGRTATAIVSVNIGVHADVFSYRLFFRL